MSQSKEKRLADEIINPMLRLVSFYEISNYYNYLPGRNKECFDYAWAFYYIKLCQIEKEITNNTELSQSEKNWLNVIRLDIKGIITNDDYHDTLIKHWCEGEPKLLTMTTRAELFSALLEEEAFDTIEKLGFGRDDLAIEAVRRELNYTEGNLRETLLLLNAFTWNVIKATEASFDRVKILSYISEYLDDTSHFTLSKQEEDEARFYASVVDIGEIRKEGDRRLYTLAKRLGKFEQVMEYDDDEVLRLQNEENFYTYHIIREADADYYLGVETSKVYWDNHRHGKYVQCYRKSESEGRYKTIAVEVRDGKLRVAQE